MESEANKQTHKSPRWLPWVAVIALVLTSAIARDTIGTDWTTASVRELIAGLGWKGPAVFVLMVMFRVVLLLPSAVILPLGGVCFGALLGTFYGALGVTVSGLVNFGVARWVGRDAIARVQVPSTFTKFASDRTTALVVAFATAYPLGPATPVHAGAGLTSISLALFAPILVASAAFRAGTYSFFGSSLVDGEGTWLAGAVLAAVITIPLLSPRVREWIRGSAATETKQAGDSE